MSQIPNSGALYAPSNVQIALGNQPSRKGIFATGRSGQFPLIQLSSEQTRTARSYFPPAGSETTRGNSMFGAASPKALNCSGLRNITEHPEQA